MILKVDLSFLDSQYFSISFDCAHAQLAPVSKRVNFNELEIKDSDELTFSDSSDSGDYLFDIKLPKGSVNNILSTSSKISHAIPSTHAASSKSSPTNSITESYSSNW